MCDRTGVRHAPPASVHLQFAHTWSSAEAKADAKFIADVLAQLDEPAVVGEIGQLLGRGGQLGLRQPDLLASDAKCMVELQPPIIGSPLAGFIEQLSELPALVTSFG